MKITNFLTCLLFVVFSMGCSDDDNAATIIEGTIEISVTSASDGADLLSPQTPGFYKKDEIHLYELIGEEKILVNNPNMDFPNGFMIFKDTEEIHRIRIFGNMHSENPILTNIIEWNATESDTIQYEVFKGDNLVKITRIWFNDEEKWAEADQTERYFSIVKHL